jgi:hypothetical protein
LIISISWGRSSRSFAKAAREELGGSIEARIPEHSRLDPASPHGGREEAFLESRDPHGERHYEPRREASDVRHICDVRDSPQVSVEVTQYDLPDEPEREEDEGGKAECAHVGLQEEKEKVEEPYLRQEVPDREGAHRRCDRSRGTNERHARRGVLEAMDETREGAPSQVKDEKGNPSPTVLQETADDPEEQHVPEKVPDTAVDEDVREERIEAIHLARDETEKIEDASVRDLLLLLTKRLPVGERARRASPGADVCRLLPALKRLSVALEGFGRNAGRLQGPVERELKARRVLGRLQFADRLNDLRAGDARGKAILPVFSQIEPNLLREALPLHLEERLAATHHQWDGDTRDDEVRGNEAYRELRLEREGGFCPDGYDHPASPCLHAGIHCKSVCAPPQSAGGFRGAALYLISRQCITLYRPYLQPGSKGIEQDRFHLEFGAGFRGGPCSRGDARP